MVIIFENVGKFIKCIAYWYPKQQNVLIPKLFGQQRKMYIIQLGYVHYLRFHPFACHPSFVDLATNTIGTRGFIFRCKLYFVLFVVKKQ